ncbi:MAG TPA: lysophospholipid acyltransferase family protein [Aestuariivirga sp.]|nr:lysophospholipid acyltransferase family protein [Aestuariivirga sp.]
MNTLRAAFILFVFTLLTLPLMPLQQLFVWFWPAMAKAFPMHYHRLVLRLLGIRLKVIGSVAKGPLLIASNHASWLDIPVLSALAPLSFIAKREVNSWPFFGSLARLQRTQFIDRNTRHSTGSSRNEMQARLKAGDILVLFAEGTSGTGQHVLPFKSAFFGAAEIPGMRVQPLTIAYSGHRNLPMNRRLRPLYAWYGRMQLPAHLWSALKQGPIEVTVICHEPLAVETGTSRKTLARLAETLVAQGLSRALHQRGEMG